MNMKLNDLLEIRDRLSNALDIIDDQLLRYDWWILANCNQKLPAIRAYRMKNECTFEEAKKKVESYIECIKN